jgi:hypothetical protein
MAIPTHSQSPAVAGEITGKWPARNQRGTSKRGKREGQGQRDKGGDGDEMAGVGVGWAETLRPAVCIRILAFRLIQRGGYGCIACARCEY